ncbi:MAG: phosphate propanoyltransferase [Cetobacterium sp.]|nr:phosphate propanoyltransferase [Cetobacterium sp.]
MSMELDKLIEVVKEKMEKKIPVEGSGRHIHLSHEDGKKLFGENYEFTILKELSQPGQVAYKERVRLIGPKGVIEGVVILGPSREKTQVELSLTDTRILGVKGVLRESGHIENTPGIVIGNGDKVIEIKEGVIVAKNHIHMNEEEAKNLNVEDKDLVKIKIYSERPVIFEDVLIRVNKNFKLAMHIDYDEGNSCMLNKESFGVIYE